MWRTPHLFEPQWDWTFDRGKPCYPGRAGDPRCLARFLASLPLSLPPGAFPCRVHEHRRRDGVRRTKPMTASKRPVVVCSYLTRDRADECASRLRRRGVTAAAVPSDERSSCWDVLVSAADATRGARIVKSLLVPD